MVDLGDGETYEYLYEAVYDNGVTSLHDIMEEWYTVLAAAHGVAD